MVGFDDIPEASWEAYRLSTFRQDPADMALPAIEQLERWLADPGAPLSTAHFEAGFIERETTAS